MSDPDKAYQIAEDRIERAKATGARGLSLSPHYSEDGKYDPNNTPELRALDRIPPGIADLTDLQSLYLYDTQVEDISHLAAITGMQTLDLRSTQVEDISHLAAMTGMQSLNLSITQVEDISHLAAMTGMQTLNLNSTKVEDISHLAAMTGMQSLYLSSTQVEDISHLAAMTGMQTLNLNFTKVEDISHLAAMTGMQTLNLNFTKVEDISHLAAMTGMQTLYLHDTKVKDISHLAAMTGMQTLDLSGTKVEDISHLAAMTGMVTLRLDNTMVDLGQLVAEGAAWAEGIHALRDLDFRGTPAAQEGECLDGLYDAHDDDEGRTKAALAALRAERDQRKVEGPEAPARKDDDYHFEQSEDDRLRLTDIPLIDDEDQAALQDDLRQRAEDLDQALSGSNEFAGLAADALRYAALLAKPAAEIGAKQVWSLAHRFRAALDAEVEADRQARLSDLLPPRAKAALEALVVTGGAWLLDHPGVAALEEKSRHYRRGAEDEDVAELAAPIINDLVADDGVMVPDSAAVGADNLRQASIGGPIGDMAIKQTRDFTRGIVIDMLKRVWKGGVWGAGGLIFVGGLDGGLAAIGRFVARNGPALRDWMSKVMADGVEYLEAILKGLGALF